MSQTNIAVTQLAQLGFADRIAQEAQGHPEVARQTAQQAAAAMLKQQKDSVGKMEEAENARALKPEKDGNGKQSAFGNRQRRKEKERPEETGEGANTPWAGNIVNLKV